MSSSGTDKGTSLLIEAFEKDYRGVQYKEYDTRYTFGQIVLYSIEQRPDKQECYLTLSGEGCHQLEKHLKRFLILIRLFT